MNKTKDSETNMLTTQHKQDKSIRRYHNWNVQPSEAISVQHSLADAVVLKDRIEQVKIIAGADVSYRKQSNTLYAGWVLMHYPELTVLEQAYSIQPASFPYIPGLLSFREGKSLLDAFDKLILRPDLILFDGQGIAHPRFIGIASHLGVLLDIPSIGVGKSRLVGQGNPPAKKRGAVSLLTYKGRTVCAQTCTKNNINPVFISPGHNICMQTSVKWVLLLCRGYKLPEPTRTAHNYVNHIRREHTISAQDTDIIASN